jgi:ABC-type lipoprotein release transport system permease subunit
MPREIVRSADYARRFHLVREKNHQKIATIKSILNQESHLFIVVLGAVIGTILAIFIAYHLKSNPLIYTLLSVIPFALSYSLRKVYIHTLIHSQE